MSSDRLSLNGSLPSKRKPTLDERNRQADQTLTSRYDALNQAFVEAEKRLKALKPLHPVWLDYGHVRCEGEPEWWELLGLTKYQGKWRLCHASDHEMNDYGFDNIKPVVECAVDVRVRAAKAVRQLHEAMTKQLGQRPMVSSRA